MRRLKQLQGLHTDQIFAFFDDEQLRSYLPDTYIANPRKADRQFIIDVCNTLDANRMELLVKAAVDERNKRQDDKLGQTIKIDKRLLDAFTDPYIISSKPPRIQICAEARGRAAPMMKQKAHIERVIDKRAFPMHSAEETKNEFAHPGKRPRTGLFSADEYGGARINLSATPSMTRPQTQVGKESIDCSVSTDGGQLALLPSEFRRGGRQRRHRDHHIRGMMARRTSCGWSWPGLLVCFY